MKPWTWDVFSQRAAPTPEVQAELSQLRAALPAYHIVITSHSPACRFEAIRHRLNGPGPWCVISTDPADLWRELASWSRQGPNVHALPANAP